MWGVKMSVVKVNKENFEEIKSENKTVLLDFYAEWCAPCRAIAPIVENIAEENQQYLIGKINVDEEQELAARYDVSSIPTLIIMKNGEILKRSIGLKSKQEILAMLKR